MLEQVNLEARIPKSEYRDCKKNLQRRLLTLQRACWEAQLSTLVVIEGWDGSGKGSVINRITEGLEPRAFKLYSIHEPRTYETHLPWLWRFWEKLPNWGEMAIFDHSWYGRVIEDRIEARIPEPLWRQAFVDINSFERKLAEDRYRMVKFFLHIDKKNQKKRFKKLESDPLTAWTVDDDDWKRHRRYEEYLVVFEEMLGRTETEWAPWTIVEAKDRRWARIKVLRTLVEQMEGVLKLHGLNDLHATKLEELDEFDEDRDEEPPIETGEEA